jgi:predicted aconitase
MEPRITIAGYDDAPDVRLAAAAERIADALERLIVLMEATYPPYSLAREDPSDGDAVSHAPRTGE